MCSNLFFLTRFSYLRKLKSAGTRTDAGSRSCWAWSWGSGSAGPSRESAGTGVGCRWFGWSGWFSHRFEKFGFSPGLVGLRFRSNFAGLTQLFQFCPKYLCFFWMPKTCHSSNRSRIGIRFSGRPGPWVLERTLMRSHLQILRGESQGWIGSFLGCSLT